MINDILTLLSERSDFFIKLSIEHLMISIISIIIAIVLGGIIGIIVSEFHNSSKPILGTINFLYTIPSISMLGFLIPFSGIGNTTAVIALTIYALLPMVRNTYTGITNVDKNILEAARGMGSTDFQILYKIKLPLALPVIMSGIRNMVIMTIALAGIASFIGAGGLGVAIYRGITTNNTVMTITGSILIALLALIFDFILGLVEKFFQRKRKKKNRKKVFAILGSLILIVTIFTSYLLNPSKTQTIHIATKPMTEQYILGEMLDILIEKNTGLNVEITQGVGGGTSNIQPAMENGEFDIYPEYTGTGWNMVLKKNELYTESMFNKLQSEYKTKLKMQWAGMYGFSNNYALAVRKEVADKYNLKNISDLKDVSSKLTFGAEYDFYEREDGYTPLCNTYGLNFKDTVDLDIGLKYQAINEGKIDVMPIFTTDGQYSVSDVVVLKDDKNFYPSYQCGNVVRSEVLEENPELSKVFKMVGDILTDKEMAKMNYDVENNNLEPREVAREFLNKKGLL
ncbi:TPA: ABC transporter permease subunit [Clostridioides difficile]|uniref:ABC transporter permease/substrate-binding protein n=1 Tax=Clostridioides difficile TaxID=1496 RepID=UPI0010BA5A4D|nr:glycine betaine ABC transporter substrate-binding protein [Clostridioides difficile]MCP8650239.1 ABC transporter permease subunit [Clostridioides difficile]MDM0193988.1 glycine betaine ABC transporter substrate-binding protein [Clostridioides difficile]VIB63151.1 ABC transporter glycine betaine/carnitine/choline permease [Clostridioides difficile]HBE9528967.1 ABC transporter permease subunit [Clostridioides difficile]HBF0044588.1 ABC transporter permease subunit [Clostridioides difficile]